MDSRLAAKRGYSAVVMVNEGSDLLPIERSCFEGNMDCFICKRRTGDTVVYVVAVELEGRCYACSGCLERIGVHKEGDG